MGCGTFGNFNETMLILTRGVYSSVVEYLMAYSYKRQFWETYKQKTQKNKKTKTKNKKTKKQKTQKQKTKNKKQKTQKGLIHISQVSNYRIAHPNESVEVGEQVWVKVLSKSQEGKISLSMKYVNQSKPPLLYFDN